MFFVFFTCNVNANEIAKTIIKKLEGFSPICKKDYWQISGGYGSGKLCKNGEKTFIGRKVSESQAINQLNQDYQEFANQVSHYLHKVNTKYNVKLYYKPNQIHALTISAYQKGAKNMESHRIYYYAALYKNKQIGENEMQDKFLKLSCVSRGKGKKMMFDEKLHLGLLARHYAEAQFFLGKVKSAEEFLRVKNNPKLYKKYIPQVKKFCQNRVAII